ncbi:MAG: DeoR faimly transcriptional regulator [Peptococcaceae bacterium BRH_c8a]|nr:MAG: DeoR faimly transcriptional regulator [Peptococcaceae bacterium BRH_c8a]
MIYMSQTKLDRQGSLVRHLEDNPFLTDDDLARVLGVSIQTVRLDRVELDIPEMRARISKMARESYQELRAIAGSEIVGELVDLVVGQRGMSVLEVTGEMTLQKTRVLNGQYLFAQANTLAVGLIGSNVTLTGTARVSYKRPVLEGEKVVARAIITAKKGNKYMVRVSSQVKDELVFMGKFLVFDLSKEVKQLEDSP